MLLKLMWGRSWIFFLNFKIFACSGKIQPLIYSIPHASIMFTCPVGSTKAKKGCIFLSSTQRQSTDSCLTWRELYCLPNKGTFQTLTHISVSQKETDIHLPETWLTSSCKKSVRGKVGVRVSEQPTKSSQVMSGVLVSSENHEQVRKKKMPSSVCQD